jgi:hypothetical protein
MEDGVPTSSIAEGTGLLRPDLTFTASLTPPPVTAGMATSSAAGGSIHAVNYGKHSAIQPLTALNFSTGAGLWTSP